MSAYDNHPQVARFGDRGYTVVGADRATYTVLHTEVFGWTICQHPNLDFVPTADGGFAIGYNDADEAIAALIGEPQR